MPAASGDAPVGGVSREDIARLAGPYDRWVHALDPFSEDTAAAERDFNRELGDCFDVACIRHPELKQVGFAAFRRELIKRIRQHLRSGDRPGTI